jgi:hypothetical protein
MRFAPPQLHLDCSGLLCSDDTGAAAGKLAEHAIPLIHRFGFVIFRLGRLRLADADSRALAAELAERLLVVLVDRGAPTSMRLEQDAAQVTYVPDGFSHRTLLPHHDGQHCSYLTPSVADDPRWESQWREFGTTGYTTTPAHKMYQGVFITDPGEGISVTTYYNWLGMLATVRARTLGGSGSASPAGPGHATTPGYAMTPGHATGDTARWLGANLSRALAAQDEHGSPYPSLGAMLGRTEPLWRELSFHHAEAPLSESIRKRHPGAAALAAACPCGLCIGESARVFCHMMRAATGWSWRECRDRWEILAPSERFDLVFGHNLIMLHGGWAGGASRVIEPMCLVVDRPEGAEYERWLAAAWRRRLPAADQVMS